MDEKNFSSSSDDSDADFVPKEEEDNSDSRSEVSDYQSAEEDNSNNKTRKRKKRSKKGEKKSKKNKIDKEKEEKEVDEEQKEIDVDALWADFKKDVKSQETKKTAESPKASTENLNDKSSENPIQTNSLNSKPKSGFSFPNKNKASGLSKVLIQIGKKDKMSTLQKSQLDWNKFKRSEGIEEEIKMYNRGKDGFLEKQDFLERTDLRQFEIEKDLRSARRKF